MALIKQVRQRTDASARLSHRGTASTVMMRAAALNCSDQALAVTPHCTACEVLTSRGTALPQSHNHLLELLPRKDRQRLLAACESIDLMQGDTLCPLGLPQRHAYFPTRGLISRVARFEERADLEVGLVGCEGMLGETLLLGVSLAPWRGLVVLPGQALRISARTLRSEIAECPALRKIVDRYLAVRLEQMVEAAGCLRFHEIGPRLARWLLESLDRGAQDQLRVTHETLARLLGVRRVGITTAAGALQRQGLIAYHHGSVKLQDRAGLEAVACSCYRADTSSYRRLLGNPWPQVATATRD